MSTQVGQGTCSVCGSAVNVMHDHDGGEHYRPVGQFNDRELEQLAEALKIVLRTHGAQVLPETAQRMAALRTKCLSLAFMEVGRDA